MKHNPYIGHPSQLCCVEEVRLIGGKGDGMRLLQIRTPAGLEMTVSADRCADISRLIFKGVNIGYFSPCGYVAPAYYDCNGFGFLKSFSAGFLTTCGLMAAGAPCNDEGEALPLHGTVANIPCDRFWWTEDEENIYVHAEVTDGRIFEQKMHLSRLITVSKNENRFTVKDTVENRGDQKTPLMLLYHMNMGYPLLSEKAVLDIPSVSVEPRNEHAAEDLETWNKILPPTKHFEEQCYFHTFGENAYASLYNPEINKGVRVSFDPDNLDYFTQWKMMGDVDYVMGLEPGNCTPDGRAVMRRDGTLKFLEPDETAKYEFSVVLFEK